MEERDHVTFVELQDHLEQYMETRGTHAYELKDNIVAWTGLSERLGNLLIELTVEDKQIHLWPTSQLVYMIDGGILRMPIAKEPPKQGYKEPHWLPVCFRTVKLQ